MHQLMPLALSEGGGLSEMFNVGVSSTYWTIVIFCISLPLMWKVGFGPISKALLEREEKAREAAAQAEAAKEETAAMREAVQADLEQARREAAEQVQNAKVRAEEREKEILAKAQEEAERERARSREEIERAKASALEEIRSASVELTVSLSEKVLGREFGDADQQRLVDQLRSEVSSN